MYKYINIKNFLLLLSITKHFTKKINNFQLLIGKK